MSIRSRARVSCIRRPELGFRLGNGSWREGASNCRVSRNRVLAPAAGERRVRVRPTEGSPGEEDGVYLGADQELLLGVFQDFVERRDRRLDAKLIQSAVAAAISSALVKVELHFSLLGGNLSPFVYLFFLFFPSTSAVIEARDVCSYLRALEPHFEDIKSSGFKDIQAKLRPLLHCVCLLWANSKYYCTSTRIVTLLLEISNLLISEVFLDSISFSLPAILCVSPNGISLRTQGEKQQAH